MSSSGFGRKSKSGDYDLRGSAARKLAIESLRNIANVNISGSGVEGAVSPETDPELAAIIGVLRGAGTPLAVTEVAERLRWKSDKTANALARGGESGVLRFSTNGETTTVSLAET